MEGSPIRKHSEWVGPSEFSENGEMKIMGKSKTSSSTAPVAPITSSLDRDPAHTGATVNQVAEALAATLETQRGFAASIDAALSTLDKADKSNAAAFLAVFNYFDVGTSPAYKSVDSHATMDAAIAVKYRVAEGDTAGMKRARDVNTYRRRKGAEVACGTLRGSGSSTPTVKADAVKVRDYLVKMLPKLDVFSLAAVAEQVNTAFRAAEAAAQSKAA